MKLYDKEELRDSRIFFDKRPPNYLFYLHTFLIFLIGGSLVASNFLTRNSVVRAQGTIEANDTAFITPTNDGMVVEIHRNSGEWVETGDVLFVLSTGVESVQEEDLQRQLESLKARNEMFDRFEQSLNNRENLMKNEGEEARFYGRIAHFLTQIKDEVVESEQTMEAVEQRGEDIQTLEAEQAEIRLQSQTRFQREWNRLQTNWRELWEDLLRLDEEANEENDLSAEMRAKEALIRTVELQMEDLQIDVAEQLETQMDENRSEIQRLEREANDLSNMFDLTPTSATTYFQLISELGADRMELNTQIGELESQLQVQASVNQTLTITAHRSGYLHYLFPLSIGLGLQALEPIGQINSGEESLLIVESFVPAQNISRVSNGDIVRVELAGVNRARFGMLKGRIENIGNGTITRQDEDGQPALFHKVTVSLNGETLESNGEVIEARATMPVSINIVYQNETYLMWLLNQIDFRK